MASIFLSLTWIDAQRFDLSNAPNQMKGPLQDDIFNLDKFAAFKDTYKFGTNFVDTLWILLWGADLSNVIMYCKLFEHVILKYAPNYFKGQEVIFSLAGFLVWGHLKLGKVSFHFPFLWLSLFNSTFTFLFPFVKCRANYIKGHRRWIWPLYWWNLCMSELGVFTFPFFHFLFLIPLSLSFFHLSNAGQII